MRTSHEPSRCQAVEIAVPDTKGPSGTSEDRDNGGPLRHVEGDPRSHHGSAFSTTEQEERQVE
jgi:hypothetical protein